ncbi:uncharacterized protein MYCFIDRAFT_117555, partial [Pseudocercospora fijiensis CIRAD86]
HAIVLQATGRWQGMEPKWSTFSLNIGSNPSQTFDFLPSISSSQIWLPDPNLICPKSNESVKHRCLESRGIPLGTSSLDRSSTWLSQGTYHFLQHPLLFSYMTGDFGQDTVALTTTSTSAQAVAENQLVAQYGLEDYWIGLAGLTYRSTPLGNGSTSSLLTSLKENGTIPSLSFGYTAGSVYGKVYDNFGALTLGGYDASRRSPQPTENLEVSMDRTKNELKVELLDISVSNGSTGGQRTLLPIGKTYSMFLDTSVSEFWFPSEVCDLFQGSFNLTEDLETGLFGIDHTSRQAMFDNNTSLSLVLGGSSDATTKLKIDLGCEAFGNFSYFPIRRAVDESKFVLGRVFFQETYITVDWTWKNFTLSKAQPRVRGIAPNPQDISTPEIAPPAPPRLSSGDKAGIAIGCLMIVSLTLGLLWWVRRRR